MRNDGKSNSQIPLVCGNSCKISISDRSMPWRGGPTASKEILTQAGQELIIPMNARCESLNAAVAATIVMWQMTKL